MIPVYLRRRAGPARAAGAAARARAAATMPAMPEPSPSERHPSDVDPRDLEAQRRANRDAVIALGLSPYGARTTGLVTVAEARERYDEVADLDHREHAKDPGFEDRRPVVSVAGRVMLHRDNGKLVWMQLRDHTSEPETAGKGDLQIAVSQRDCDEKGFQLAKIADLGDILIATGPLAKTKTGEITVWATKLDIACKSLAPPPEKWAGLQDPELRYRRRYVDLYANPETMSVTMTRSRLLARIRRFLDERGFVEVETPMMQSLAGGAAARPFVTHMNALDIDLFMRVAPELYLKRLLVGGMPRVFELNRNFRNEGLDRQHNPEFTMLEIYEAFGDYNTMMELTETLLRGLAHGVAAAEPSPDAPTDHAGLRHVRLPFGDLTIDYGAPFRRVTYGQLFEQALGFPMTDTRRAREEAKKRGLKHEGLADIYIVNELFEALGEKAIEPDKPTFVLDYPAPLCPLTRPKPSDPSVAERFELFIGGMELANAYTELNDPDIQEAKFREQLAGADDEQSTFRTFDADFVEALKVGMPPAGGLGIGIDRLVMLLTNQRSIRDVILFPFMRPA